MFALQIIISLTVIPPIRYLKTDRSRAYCTDETVQLLQQETPITCWLHHRLNMLSEFRPLLTTDRNTRLLGFKTHLLLDENNEYIKQMVNRTDYSSHVYTSVTV